MSASIGKAALVLTTDASDAKAGLAKFGKDVNHWAETTGSQSKQKFQGGMGLGKAGLLGLFAGAGAAVGGGLVNFAGDAIGHFKELGQRIDDAGDAAKRLGMDTGNYQGLQWAAQLAGASIEELDAGLGKFRRSVSGPLDEALFDFAKRLEAVQDPGQRAQMLFDAFGKAGPKMALMFEDGEDGLRKMVDEAKALGFAVSDLEAEKIGAANDAMDRATKAVDGLWSKVVVALAPAFEAAGDVVTKVASKLAPVFDWIGRAIDAVFSVAGPMFDELVGAIEWIVSEIGNWISETLGLGQMTLTIKDVVVGAFRLIGTVIALTWDTLKTGAGIAAIAFGAILEYGGSTVSLFRTIVDLGRKLPDSLKPAGFDQFADHVAAADDKVRGWGRGLKNWGQEAVSSWGQSAVQFNQWLDKVSNQQKESAKATKAEAVELAEAMDAMKASASGNAALIKGTSAEVSARLKHDFGGRIQEQQLAELKKNNGLLKEVKQGVKDLAPSAQSGLLPM